MLRTHREIYSLILAFIMATILLPLTPIIIDPSNWIYPSNTPTGEIILGYIVSIVILAIVVFAIVFIFKQIRAIDTKLEDEEVERHKELLKAVQNLTDEIRQDVSGREKRTTKIT
ncbi:MAG: hypothetical protein PHQ86_02910 [Dehalococcoidales bacterium]|nr:hypothetical protein [Dehalococcoidales bacterium]